MKSCTKLPVENGARVVVGFYAEDCDFWVNPWMADGVTLKVGECDGDNAEVWLSLDDAVRIGKTLLDAADTMSQAQEAR